MRKREVTFDEEFIQDLDENNDKGYILEADVKYPKRLHELHSDLRFLPERIKIDKYEKLVYSLYDTKNYVNTHRSLKAGIKKIHRLINFSQESYIDRNTELRTKANNNFEKEFSKLMNNSVFGKSNGKSKEARRHQLTEEDVI